MCWHLDYLAWAFFLETLKSCQHYVFLCISCKVVLRAMPKFAAVRYVFHQLKKVTFNFFLFFCKFWDFCQDNFTLFHCDFFHGGRDVSLSAVSISRNDMQIADSVLENLSVFYEIKKLTGKFTVFLLFYEESSDCMCVCAGSTKKAGGFVNSSGLFQWEFLHAHNKGVVWTLLSLILMPEMEKKLPKKLKITKNTR